MFQAKLEYLTESICIAYLIYFKTFVFQVLVNAACLVGNLATCEQDQSSLRDCLEALCTLLKTHPQHKDIQVSNSLDIVSSKGVNICIEEEKGRSALFYTVYSRTLLPIIKMNINICLPQ